VKVIVTVDARLYATPDGKVWCDNQFNFPHTFWQRYLVAFDEVEVVCRVVNVKSQHASWREVTGERVTVHGLPFYLGPWQYLKNYWHTRRVIHQCIRPGQAYIFRVGSVLADMLRPELVRRKLPYAVEVIGDPWDMFGPGGVTHPLRPIFRWWFTRQLKKVCQTAACGSYVTERLLQERYPAPNATLTVSASSIVLGDEAIAPAPRQYELSDKARRLITVGSLEHPHKGVDLLIEAAALLQKELPIELVILGDGRMRGEFEALARARKVSAQFLGTVPGGEAVRRLITEADIFVLASRADGMPRAMIEAMALGLFCVGSRVGGMQELLPARWLAPMGDAAGLAKILKEGLTQPELMTKAAGENWAKAKTYHQTILEKRRQAMYRELRRHVEEGFHGKA
jgi:glycosyltransferase involved in cell wall biosynthesis